MPLYLFFLMIIIFALSFGSFALAETEPVGNNPELKARVEAEYGPFTQWQWYIRTTVVGEDPPSYEGNAQYSSVNSPLAVNTTNDTATVTINLDRIINKTVTPKPAMSVKADWVLLAVEFNGEVEISDSESVGKGYSTQYPLSAHKLFIAKRQPMCITQYYSTDKVLQIRRNGDNEWIDTKFTEHIGDSSADIHFVFQMPVVRTAPCQADKSQPEVRDPETGVWSYPCSFEDCKGFVPKEFKGHDECTITGATCTKRGSCSICGKYGPEPRGHHVYNYAENYEIISESTVKFPCIYCSDPKYHIHEYKDDYYGPVPAENDYLDFAQYLMIQGDSENHKRLYLDSRACNYAYCPQETKRKDLPVYKVEPHTTWTTLDSKPATCLEDGYIIRTCDACSIEIETSIPALGKHEYDYTKPQIISEDEVHYPCKNAGCQDYEEHFHHFTSDGPKPTNDTRIIPENYSKHERKYVEHKECDGEHCDETRTVETWKEETHSWRNEVRKEATCLKDGSITHICAGCEMVETIPIWAPGSHDPDYDHPIEYSEDEIRYPCKRSGCNEIAEFHRHTFSDNGDPKPQNKYLKITGDSKNHKRLYLQPRKCSCGETRDFEKYIVESHSDWSVKERKSATCLEDGYVIEKCGKCDFEKTIGENSRGGHTYDYSRPETITNGVRFPCKYGCAGVYDSHSHSFEDDKNTAAVKTNNLQQKDATYHKRRYDIKQVCNKKLGNGATCGATKWRYDWRDEKHTSMKKTETKAATCTADGYDKYACSDNCGYTRTDTIKAHGHVYDYSRPETTSSGYRFPCKYGCAGIYNYHSHSFVDAGEAAVKTNNLQKSDATNHKRRYDIKQVCNQKWGNGAKCGATKWRYDWRNDPHTFSNNGSAQPTNTYQQIPGNASQHNRKYTQPQKCACGQTRTIDVLKPESHPSWHNDILTKAATCTEQGVRTRMCTACDYVDTYYTAKNPNNHSYSSWTLVRTPTATDPGQVRRKCYRCGKVFYKSAR